MNNHSLVVTMHQERLNEAIQNRLHALQKDMQIYVQSNKSKSVPYDCLRAPFNEQEIDFIAQKADEQMTKAAYAALVIVGIGGSHLCIQAVEQLLQGGLSVNNGLPVYYVDTVDADRVYRVHHLIKQIHLNQKEVLLIIISKSGSTIETIANAAVLLQQFSPHQIKNSVVCITDEHSPLHAWAKKQEVQTLYIPQSVGGRFSAFTVVGLFPLACLGINIAEFCKGACAYDWKQDSGAARAAWLYNAMQKKIPMHDLFLTAADAQSLGLWYRQLMGETIGKKRVKDAVISAVGIMPTVSLCSADLHSVGQLYIAGPDVRVTTFVTIPAQTVISIPSSDIIDTVSPGLRNKSANQVLDAIVRGTMQTYAQHNLNYTRIHFPEKSAFFVGQFMYMAMVEMIYLAHLLEVNPFDQPEVELYKKATREFLAK